MIPNTGEIILESNQVVTDEHLEEIIVKGIDHFKLLFMEIGRYPRSERRC